MTFSPFSCGRAKTIRIRYVSMRIYLFIYFFESPFSKMSGYVWMGLSSVSRYSTNWQQFSKRRKKEPFLEFFVSFVFLFCFVFWFVAFPIYMCVFVYSIKLLSWRCSYRWRFIIEDKDGDCRSSWWWRFAVTYPCHHHHYCIFSLQKVV